MSDVLPPGEFRQGQWVRATIGAEVLTVLPDGSTVRPDGKPATVLVADLPPLHRGGTIGVWYPAGKTFVGMPRPLPLATFWPVDPAYGMPVEIEEDRAWRRLCFAAESVAPLSDCTLADLPAARANGMPPEYVPRLVEVARG